MGGSQRQLQLVLKLQDQASKELKRVVGEIDRAERSSRDWANTLKVAGRNLLYVGTAAAGLLGYGVKIAADLETAQVGLETLLGSADEAAETVARLKREAARTPFELPGLTQATQLLSSVTKDGDRSIDILLDIGEALAAMGKGQAELDRIIVNLQQVGSIGYASMVDIKQFAFAGIPIFDMLAKKTGLAGEALSTFIGEGNVTFEMLTQMFDEANDAGGQFFNAFVNQGGTFNQTLSNLKDSFGIFLADIAVGTGTFAGVTDAMQSTAFVLGNYDTILGSVQKRMAQFFADLDAKTGLITLMKDAWANVAVMWEHRLKPALMELWEALKPLQPILDAMVVVFGAMLVGAIGLFVLALQGVVLVLSELLTWGAKIYAFLFGQLSTAFDFITDKIALVIDVVDDLIDKFERAIELASRIGGKVGDFGASIGEKIGNIIGVNDAIIAPNGNVISTHPDDYLIATKNPRSLGGGTTININGGTYLSEDVAVDLGDRILSRLKLSNQLS